MEGTMQKMTIVVLMLVMMMCGTTWGHGMMMQPVQRSSMWRDPRFFDAPRNYDDNQLYCGGFAVQYRASGGKCGVCGDGYDAPQPHPNEAGGKFANGIIVETYQQGQVIDVTVRITANHMGYFVFKLCPNNDVTKRVTHECLDRHVLNAVGPNGEDLGEKYYIDSAVNDKHLKLQLPSDVTCTQCVLQWTYNAANSWGCDDSHNCCVGCGPQENFVNCADIAITGSGDSGNPPTQAPVPTTTTTKRPATDAPITPKPKEPTTAGPITATPRPTTATPRPATARPTTTTTTRRPAETAGPSNPGSGHHCVAVGFYTGNSAMDTWCVTNCARGYCPASHCKCS